MYYLREDFVVSVFSLFLAGSFFVVVELLRVVVLAGTFTAFVDVFTEERLSVLCVVAGFDTDLLVVVVVVVERLFAELWGAEFSVEVLTVSLWVVAVAVAIHLCCIS